MLQDSNDFGPERRKVLCSLFVTFENGLGRPHTKANEGKRQNSEKSKCLSVGEVIGYPAAEDVCDATQDVPNDVPDRADASSHATAFADIGRKPLSRSGEEPVSDGCADGSDEQARIFKFSGGEESESEGRNGGKDEENSAITFLERIPAISHETK